MTNQTRVEISFRFLRSSGVLRLIVLLVAVASGACAKGPYQWSPAPPPVPAQPLEFDLLSASATPGGQGGGQFDYNGSLLNPIWGAQSGSKPDLPFINARCEREPQKSLCTSQKPTIDRAEMPNLAICSLEVASKVKGHVNWGAAAATGQLLWLNFATDRDFNFAFFPTQNGALTRRNPEANVLDVKGMQERRRFIELEFDSRETVDHFATAWWNEFADVVRKHRKGQEIDSKLNQLAHEKSVTAAVYGLLGLDCAHDCASEFHPVYAVAIEMDPSSTNNQWAIFVRNSGNEGFCSSLDHHLAFPDGLFRLELPRTGMRPEVDLGSSQFASSTADLPFPSIDFDAKSGSGAGGRGSLVLTFKMPPPAQRANADLVLTLKWEMLDPPAMAAIQRAPGVLEAAADMVSERQSAEEILEAAKVQPALEAARVKNVNRMPEEVKIGQFTRPSAASRARTTDRQPRVELRASPGKSARDKEIITALCATKAPPAGMSARDFNRMCDAARRPQ